MIAWLALVLAVVALIVGWMALSRVPDESAVETLRTENAESIAELRRENARFQAESRLNALNTNAELRASSSVYAAEVQAIRSDLEAAYENGAAAARAEWEELAPRFDQLESQIRSGTADTLQTLRSLIGRLSEDARTE